MIQMEDHRTGNVWLDLSLALTWALGTILFYNQKIQTMTGGVEILDIVNDFFGKYGGMFVSISMIILTIFKCIDFAKRWKSKKK